MRITILLLVLSLGLGAACAVPADPGLNAKLRGAPMSIETQMGPAPEAGAAWNAQVATDARAEALYSQRCGNCHELFHPTDFSAAEWPQFVQRYGPRAGLYGQDRARVLRWLQANAGG